MLRRNDLFSLLHVDHLLHAASCLTVRNEAATCRLHLQHLSLADCPVLGGLSTGKPRERCRTAAALPLALRGCIPLARERRDHRISLSAERGRSVWFSIGAFGCRVSLEFRLRPQLCDLRDGAIDVRVVMLDREF